MKRRDFLRKTSIGAGLASVPAAAAASVAYVKSASEPAQEELKLRVEALEKQVGKLNLSQKKTIKLLMLATGLSIGLDLSLLV